MLRRGSKSTEKKPVLEEPAGVLVHRPRSNAYTGLLGVAMVALALGCLFLVLEINEYGFILSFPWAVR